MCRIGDGSQTVLVLSDASWLAELNKSLFMLTPDRELLPEDVALSTKLNHPVQDSL
jgi:hypothetical protein